MLADSSIAHAYCLSGGPADNRRMESREQIAERIRATRRRRLKEYINTFTDRGETQAAAAESLGIAPEFISQLKMTNHRGIGEALARFMEQYASLPMLWFDEMAVEQHMTPREQTVLHNFRRAPAPIQSATEAILAGHAQDLPPDPQDDIDTVVLRDKKAS